MCGLLRAFGAEGLVVGGPRASLDILTPHDPDAEQIWQDDAVVLGHRRLAIIDVDQRSVQPMVSAGGRYVIAYNSEVYNYATIRRQLAAEGVRFRTGSDTRLAAQHRGRVVAQPQYPQPQGNRPPPRPARGAVFRGGLDGADLGRSRR